MNQETGISTPAGRGAAVVECDGRTPRPAARDRGLRDAIHDALARGRYSLAGRLADAAARLPRLSSALAAAVMRVRLQQSLPEAALAASRRAARMTAELLLLRGLARLDLGQRPAARTELASAAGRGELC